MTVDTTIAQQDLTQEPETDSSNLMKAINRAKAEIHNQFTKTHCGNAESDPGVEWTMSKPPPLPLPDRLLRRRLIQIGFGIFLLSALAIPFLSSIHMIRAMRLPTTSMSPNVQSGEHFFVESVSFLWASPKRGDIVAFNREGLYRGFGKGISLARIAGLPGDSLRVVEGRLYVNDQPHPLLSSTGEVVRVVGQGSLYLTTSNETFLVPPNHYFVLGDNSANSADSRYWGPLPAQRLVGRKLPGCYWREAPSEDTPRGPAN